MGLNVLIVDDSSLTRQVIEKTLRMTKVAIDGIRHAANGREALEALRKSPADLVFSDINMPVMNGIQFLDEKNADALISAIPVVIISTDSSNGRADQLKERHVKSFISKPFTPEMVEKIMSSTLEAKV